MRPKIILPAAIILALCGLGHAEAAYINFTFLGAGISGAGVATVQANATGGGYTALTGTLDVFGDPSVRTADLVANPDGTSTANAPGVPVSFSAFDDQVFPGATPSLDSNGLFFKSGVNDIFIYSYSYPTLSYAYLDFNTETGSYSQTVGLQFLVSAVQSGSPPALPALGVPEPSSLALCGIAGMMGLGAARARRKPARA